MKTPIIIAAYNEADYIGRTLAALNRDAFDPIVVANGCKDVTVDIALDHGATVVELDEPAKMPALQAGVKHLGKRALEPFLLTDADARPLFPKAWRRIMLGSLPDDCPGTSAGPICYTDGKLQDRLYNTYVLGRTILYRWRHNQTFMTGNNMAVHLKTPDMLDAFMDLPNMWPGEDAAISKTIYRAGGAAVQVIDPRAYVEVSTRTAITFEERRELGYQACEALNYQRYLERAPKGSLPAATFGY